MYNWSTDESKFKKLLSFLESHPQIKSIEVSGNKGEKNSFLVKSKYVCKITLVSDIHPAIKTALAFTLKDLAGDLEISVIEKEKGNFE